MSEKDPGKDWPQILAIVVACIPGLSSALLFSWPSPFILVLTQDKEHYDISEDEANLLPVLLPLGVTFSAIFFFKIHDVIGRKYTLLLLNVPQATFWIITIFARDIRVFYIARVISGIADALMYAALPIYIGEVTTPRIRGTWGTGQTFSFNAGFLFINLIGSYCDIRQTAYICLCLPVIFLLIFMWLPETPYYYAMKGQDAKARDSLKWLLRKPNIESDFLQLKADVQRQISETGTWSELFTITSNRRALTACVFLRVAQAMAGISTFETYVQFIFEKSGSLTLSPQMSSIYFSGFLWLVMTGVTFVLDRLGRRKALAISCLGSGIILLSESIYFYLNQPEVNVDVSMIQWFPLAGMIAYVFFYSIGLGLLPSLMTGELFSVSIKGKALSVTNIAMGIIVAVGTYTFKSLNSAIGLYAPFLVFACCTFVSFILSFYLIPETKGKTLEEIQQNLKGNKIETIKRY